MKPLSFKIKAYRRRAYTLRTVKQYAAQRLQNPKSAPYIDPSLSDIMQGIVLAAYTCSLYKHAGINLWYELRYAHRRRLIRVRYKLDKIIEQAYIDGFMYEPEYISAKRCARYILSLIYAHQPIKIPSLFKRGYTNF